MTTTQDIRVPALREADNVRIPEFTLARDVSYLRDSDNKPLTPVAYNQKISLPTLAELHHAYFDKNPDGSWVCPDYRARVGATHGYAE